MSIGAVIAGATGGGDELLLSLFVTFAAAKLAAELFERMGQPALVGEILAGVVVGPSLLGWVHPNEILSAISEIGVVLLLFSVGLDVHPRALFRVGARATAVAVSGVVVPFIAGWALMRAWGAPTIEGLFVGATLVATSVGITARVLSGMGLLELRTSQIILGAAVIDDVLGLLVLSVVSAMAKGGGLRLGEVALSTALSVGFVVLMFYVGPKFASKAGPIAERFRLDSSFLFFSLLLCLGLSYLASRVGIAPIIGAFLAGMALSETSVETQLRAETATLTEALAPFFFVGIGLRLDLAAFRDPTVIALALALTAIAVVTKLVGCGAAALSMGTREALQIGVGMVPRGEVGILVAQIGLASGVIPIPVYGAVVFMAVATTLAAPPVLVHLFPRPAAATPSAEAVDSLQPEEPTTHAFDR